MISVVVPVYNEESVLSKNFDLAPGLSQEAEFIFVDGGSADRSVDIAGRYGKVLHSAKGRAIQMNFGASQARGDILLFLHADSIISAEALRSIKRKVNEGGCLGGCLTQRIDNKSLIYRLIESEGNLRARSRKIFYGDQGIFVKKNIFSDIGGFPEAPILEDVLFTRKLRRTGKIVVLPDKITVSARRWEKAGIIKTVFIFDLIILLFKLKVPLSRLKQLYEDIR